MRHGSATWSEPFVLRADESRTGVPLATNFNDKESLTADPTDDDGNRVDAVWDRLVLPNDNAPLPALEHSRSSHGPTWFARATSGAAATPVWEPARPIYDPGVRSQTISNQIVVHPNGTLIDGFYLFKSTGAQADRGTFIAAIRSTDKGANWSKKAINIAPAQSIGETDPEPINCRPFITGNPPVLVGRRARPAC
jgi:hypothetical protein